MVTLIWVSTSSGKGLLPDLMAITWTSVDFSLTEICAIHLWAIPQEVLLNLIPAFQI